MFKLLIRLLGLWGIVDALWLAFNPNAWSNFWQRQLKLAAEKQALPRILAVMQFLVSSWLFGKLR